MKNGRVLLGTTRTLLLVVGLAILPTVVKAQTATLSGTVTDSTGAVVTGATVTATNTATSIDRTTQSTDTGAYTIPSLPPSIYTVTFFKDGL